MAVGEPTAVGVDRQPSARRQRAAGDKRPALALGTEAEVLEEEDRVDREGVVELQHVDVGGRGPRGGGGAGGRPRRRRPRGGPRLGGGPEAGPPPRPEPP